MKSNKAKHEWRLTTWPDGHQCEKHYVDGQYTGEFRKVTDPARTETGKAQPQPDYIEAARKTLTPEAATRYAAGDMEATDEAGHQAIAEEVTSIVRQRDKGKPELPPYEPFWDNPNYAQPQAQHSPLPWQALDWMILSDKVNDYGNFYVAEVSPQFYEAADATARAQAEANLKLIVASVNHADKLAEALRECVTTPGALAERSHEYALRRLASITATASEALAAYDKAKGARQ